MDVTTRSKHGGARVRFPPPLVFLAWSGVGVGLQRFVAALALPGESELLLYAGAAVTSVGVALIVWAARWFKRTGQDATPWKPSPSMIAQGPYRFTRNPMYVGMAIAQVGVGLVVDNLWIAILAGAALVCVHFIAVRPEEAYLAERFGEGYERYRAAVGRYVGRW
jgi:protein-S-isoprenylcysteine O-methyltransferase Ste14